VIRPIPLRFTLSLAAALSGAAFAQTPSGDGRSAASRTLHERIETRLRTFGGTLGVAALDLKTGEQVAVNADARYPTASLIKTPVMAEVYHQIAAGTLRRDTSVTVNDRDKVGDESVVLNQLHGGLVVSVADLLALMTAYSDNTATNLLIGLVGTAKVNERMVSYGLTETKLFRPTFRDGRADVLPELEREFGLGMTTPREMARLFALIAEGTVVNRAVSDEMIALMDHQQDRAMIPRSLPYARDRVRVANKTGWDEEKVTSGASGHIRTDAAYVRSDRVRYVIAICARRVRDTDWGVDNEALRTGAAISRDVYDYFAERR
jgi:beta-lactamase class A